VKRSPLVRKTPLRSKPPAPVKRERAPLVLVPRPAGAPRAVMAPAKFRAAPKPVTFRSEAWLAAVRSLPCVHCGQPAEAAHRNEGKGGSIKAHDCLAAALCRPEHRRIDQGRDLTQPERRALMDRYIVLTLLELVKAGKVVLA